MPQKPIPASKVRQLLHLSAAENFNKCQSAERLGIARSSATKYIEAFKRSELTLMDIDSVAALILSIYFFQGIRAHASQPKKCDFWIGSNSSTRELNAIASLFSMCGAKKWRRISPDTNIRGLLLFMRVGGLNKDCDDAPVSRDAQYRLSPSIFMCSRGGGYHMIDENGKWELPC